MDKLLPIALLAPLVAALAALLSRDGRSARVIAIGGALASFVASLLIWKGFDPAGGWQFGFEVPWLPGSGLDLTFGVDGMSLALLLLTSFVGLCAALVSEDILARGKLHFALLALTTGATAAAFVSRNLFFFYFFCEVATLPKYLLTGMWGRAPGGGAGRTRAFAAMQQLLFIGGGALVALVSLIALYVLGGHTLDLETLTRNLQNAPLSTTRQAWLFGGLLIGFGAWVSLFPLHAWSPMAYSAAPTGAAMFFAGVSKKLGAYALIRIGLGVLPAGAQAWAECIALLAAINILYGGWVAMRQQEWQPMIGYSSVSHAGYMFLGIAAMTPATLNGVVLFMVAHGLMTALLFATAGTATRLAGTREIRGTSGLARTLPFLAVLTAMGVMASAGVPGFANFVSELMIFVGTWTAGSTALKAATIAAVFGLVVTATYLLRALRSTFYGPLDVRRAGLRETVGLSAKTACVLLAASLLLLGFQPRLLTDAIVSSVTPLAKKSADAIVKEVAP